MLVGANNWAKNRAKQGNGYKHYHLSPAYFCPV
jgi:hypothetical protein